MKGRSLASRAQPFGGGKEGNPHLHENGIVLRVKLLREAKKDRTQLVLKVTGLLVEVSDEPRNKLLGKGYALLWKSLNEVENISFVALDSLFFRPP